MNSTFQRVGLSTLLAVLVAGCSGDSKGSHGAGSGSMPMAGATRDSDKQLNIYNWFDYIDPSILPEFQREYGIHVNYDVYDTQEIVETKLLAGHTGYDLVVTATPFFEREALVGALQKLDKRQLPNLKNVDPEASRFIANFDPGNQFTIVYTWLNTTGFAFDRQKIAARLPGAPLDSWRMVFDPAVIAHFQDCGIAFIDSATDIVQAALIELGKDPNSEAPEDLAAVEALLTPIRKYLRYIDTARYISDLANGDICLALGWSGDMIQARNRAKEAGKPIELMFTIPKEGSMNGADVMVIPKDAPHPANASLFLNYLLRPDIAARISNVVGFANGVSSSVPLLREDLRNDPVVYPPPQVRAKLYPEHAKSQEYTRRLMRMWTRFKTMH
jgi:putrescine transport system substrate-binding protein